MPFLAKFVRPLSFGSLDSSFGRVFLRCGDILLQLFKLLVELPLARCLDFVRVVTDLIKLSSFSSVDIVDNWLVAYTYK